MIKPLNDYVVLQQVKTEKKVGSIIVADTKNKSNTATVVAVGPGRRNDEGKLEKIDLKVGQKVIYKEYTSTDYEENNTKYLLVRADDIIGVIE
ncbi:MAG: co-chaperone GroES [Bacilli bacterium]